MSRQLLEPRVLESSKSLGTSFNTDPINIDTAFNVGFFIYASSVTDNTGNFQIQIRPYKDVANSGDWINLGSASTLANADADFFKTQTDLPPCQVRIAFTAAGGTPDGSCDIWVSASGS